MLSWIYYCVFWLWLCFSSFLWEWKHAITITNLIFWLWIWGISLLLFNFFLSNFEFKNPFFYTKGIWRISSCTAAFFFIWAFYLRWKWIPQSRLSGVVLLSDLITEQIQHLKMQRDVSPPQVCKLWQDCSVSTELSSGVHPRRRQMR